VCVFVCVCLSVCRCLCSRLTEVHRAGNHHHAQQVHVRQRSLPRRKSSHVYWYTIRVAPTIGTDRQIILLPR
jgi:hypothetical protein